jgi:hypothetical protein
MIELDDTNHNDFLNDEARSGFGDDGESFALGKSASLSEATATVSAGLPPEGSLVEHLPIAVHALEASRPEASAQEFPPLNMVSTTSPEPTSPISEVLPSEQQSVYAPTETLPQQYPVTEEHQALPLTTSLDETIDTKPFDDEGPSFEEISRELATAFPQPLPNLNPSAYQPEIEQPAVTDSSTAFSTETISADALGAAAIGAKALFDNPSSPNTAQNTVDEHEPLFFGAHNTVTSDNDTITSERKVVTIPGADEQREHDAKRAADQKAKHDEARRNTRSRGMTAAIVFAVLLSALVASGYMLIRKTSLGSSVGNVWAKLSGQTPNPAVQDSSLALLDLTKNSQSGTAQNLNSVNTATSLNLGDTAKNATASAPATTQPITGANQTTNSAKSPLSAQTQSIAQASTTQKMDLAKERPNATQKADTPKSAPKSNFYNVTLPEKSKTQSTKLTQNSSPTIKPQAASTQAPKPQATSATKPQTPSAQASKPQATSTQAPNTPPTKQTNSQTPSAQAPKAQAAKTSIPKPKPLSSSALERRATQQINGVFAIQVYASPSLIDAEEWLERLKNRGLVNPLLTSQVVRGQTMYRVRFGLYNSLQEAERDAARFGYAGSWVVRLR